jgi:predicted ATPase
MTIKRIAVSNFKSFDNIETELGKLNVVIGPNASGKSNFVNIFKFLNDIFKSGLDNAIAMQGGVDCIRNMNLRSRRDLKIELSTYSRQEAPLYDFTIRRGRKRITGAPDVIETTYGFCLEFYKRKRGYVVKEERLECSFNVVEVKREKRKWKRGREIAKARILLTLDKMGKIELRYEPKDSPVPVSQIFPFMRFKKRIPKVRTRRSRKELSLLGPSLIGSEIGVQMLQFFSPFTAQMRNILANIALYDIDPKLSKRSTLITGKRELDSDGSNLASVLDNILSTKKNRRKLSSLMKDLLPFIEDLQVEKLADRSLLTCLREIYCGKKYLPAPLISDGTINLTAFVIAMYFEANSLIIVEEPERNIHPRLISKILDMMKDVSEKKGKQIIVTTHNSEVVKSAGLENLLLIYRHDGFSRIDRPAEKERVKNFLKNEIGIDELFVKNLLGE